MAKVLAEENIYRKPKKTTFFAVYNSLLIQYPFLVNGIQSAILAGVGVVLSQVISGSESLDLLEIRTMMIINLVFCTPVLIWFNRKLERSGSTIMAKLFFDQLVFSPLFTAGIIGLRLYLMGADIEGIPQQVLDVVPAAMKSSWLFWFPARFITLKFVPPAYHLLCGNLFALVWNVIFSMILAAK